VIGRRLKCTKRALIAAGKRKACWYRVFFVLAQARLCRF
jgi:hypothetical protein